MRSLRTQKRLAGPELGNAELAFQAWYESLHGGEAYEALPSIPRADWADYLDWYRDVTGAETRFGTRLDLIEPMAGGFRLHLTVDGASVIETARKVILANGLLGGGGPSIPEVVAKNLPKTLYAHSSERIDFTALAGKTVGVIGSAASAFDCAAVALEAGAAAVHLFARRPYVPAAPNARNASYPGAIYNYDLLPDADRWARALRTKSAGSAPPPDAIRRAAAFPNFRIHLSAPWTDAAPDGAGILATTPHGSISLDYAILGTGFRGDPSACSELAAIAGDILLWRDRVAPISEAKDADLGAYPYLGSGYQYLPKTPNAAPHLADIHVFNASGFVSFGNPVGDVPSIRRGVPAIVKQIVRDLFEADLGHHLDRIGQPVTWQENLSLYEAAIHHPSSARSSTVPQV